MSALRAAVYLRQSKDRDGNELAVSRQREACEKLCAEKGWTPTPYIDNDCSASNGKPRPEYSRMLADIKADKIDAVVVWDLDRLHRRPIELEEFIDLADAKRLALATVTGEVDLGTHNGRLYARIKGAVARSEMDQKSARQKLAAKQKAENGEAWWSARPFGFLYEDGKPVLTDGVPTLDPIEAAAIRAAYTSLLAGSSLRSIAGDLDRAGLLTPRGNRWATSSQVRQLLISPRNAGLRSYSGDETTTRSRGSAGETSTRSRGSDLPDAAWPAIVARDVWEGAVDLLSEEDRLCGTSRARKHLLSNLAVCGLCGAGMGSGVNSKGGTIYSCKSCNKLSRNAAALDDFVIEAVVQRLSEPNAIELTMPDRRADLEELRVQGRALRARLTALATEFADGDLTPAQIKTATARITEQLVVIDAALRDAQATHVYDGIIGADDVRGAFGALDLDRKRAVIERLVTITVQPTVKGSRFRREDVDLAFKG